jgi:hypothetical protein
VPTRRSLLAALGVAGSVGLAGCDGLGGGRPDARTTTETPAETASEAAVATADAGDGPSLPYRAAAESENVERPLGLVVRNVGGERRFVTVVVIHGDRTLLVDSSEYAPEGTDRTQHYPNLVARRGTYDVVVETADGATGRGVLRVDGVHRDAVVELDGEVRVRQTARCTPDCGGVSVGGEARPFGNPRWPEIDAWAGYTVTVANAGSRRHEVRVDFEIDGDTALDYRYRPPPGTVLGFPTIPPLRRLAVTVEANGDRWRGRLDAHRSVALPLAVADDGVRVDAWPDAGADLRVRNERGPQTATVALSKEGERVASWSADLGREETVTVSEFVPGPGLYEAEMTLERAGESVTNTRSVVVTRRGVLLVRVRDGIDAFFVR